jgi:hypothetical protein
VNLGYRPSSLLGEELLSAPIHSPPLSGRLIGPSAGPVHMLSTGLTGGGDRSDRSELSRCSYSVFIKWFACIRPGGVALVQGELACVQGELFVVFELWLVVCTLCLSIVFSWMCRVVALA